LPALLETNLPGLPLHSRGKVRDIYDAGEFLVIVASDRLSAFDCVLPTPIEDKGRVLTQMTLFWLSWLSCLPDAVPNHLVSSDVGEYPISFRPFRDQLEGRSMLVRRAEMLPVECVARGYLAGSGWKDYKRTGSLCGIALPTGLMESDRLPEPLFTPATKAQSGHDENISFTEAESVIGAVAGKVQRLTLQIYEQASEYAAAKGIIIADTKFEFGFVGGELILADEVLTPDSSRFWPRNLYNPGGPQPSYDKQFVRDYLESIPWNKQPPAPALPEEVAAKTAEKYREAYRMLTGKTL
jgi:phosphoribosylaminoimidazole-succinocarboxamide synthase